MSDDFYPVEVHLRERERVLELTWDDGHVSPYPLDYLRGWCTCATCQGHFRSELRFIEAPNLRLLDVQSVGNYAMRLSWSDGHDTGIYTFDYLRRICPSPAMDPHGERLQERVRVKAQWVT